MGPVFNDVDVALRQRRSPIPPPSTLMLHGVPGSRTLRELALMFAELGFGSDCIDFMKMPQHQQPRGQKHLNRGFCFINFTSIDKAEGFAKAIRHHPLGRDAEVPRLLGAGGSAA